jgi:dTDP-4-amino-4,6-dideoxygalactose transaminase
MSSSSTPAHYGGEPIRDEVLGYGSQSISETDKKAITEALEGDYITRGPAVEEFEQRVADFVGVDHAVASTSGTTALHLATTHIRLDCSRRHLYWSNPSVR